MREHNVEIRSFRVVFDLERRIHKVDDWRIPLPYGLPLRSIGYALGVLALVLLAGRVPGLAHLLGALPAPARFVLLPCGAAWALTQVSVDGRSAHAAAASILRFLLAPRNVAAGRRQQLGEIRLGDVAVVPDERATRARRAVVRGPASVLLRHGFGSRQRGRALIVEVAEDRPQMSGTRVRLQRGQRLVVR